MMRQLLMSNQNMQNEMADLKNIILQRPQGVFPSNTVPYPRENLKAITTRSGVTLAEPSVPPPPLSSSKEVERESETTTEQLPPAPISSPVIPEPNPHQPSIPYPLRLNKEKLQDKADIQIHSFLQMFKKLYFNISLSEALAHMPKFAKMVKDLLTNKEKLLELANTPLNENCSVVLLKKLPENLETLGDLSFHVISMGSTGIADDVFVQVGKFTFSADFVVVDYDVDPRVPLILGRPFLRTAHALVDVHDEELTLRVGDEKLVFSVESTSKYPRNHGDESIHKIDILDITCEDHFHEVLNIQKSINPMSGNPTPSPDPVVASLSPSLTPFGDSDVQLSILLSCCRHDIPLTEWSTFILEEIDTFLASDDLISPDVDDGTFDMAGDIRTGSRKRMDIPPCLPPSVPPGEHYAKLTPPRKFCDFRFFSGSTIYRYGDPNDFVTPLVPLSALGAKISQHTRNSPSKSQFQELVRESCGRLGAVDFLDPISSSRRREPKYTSCRCSVDYES
ncbi:reverse transcriptase domain-containing protein [Tanacetum coccineum]